MTNFKASNQYLSSYKSSNLNPDNSLNENIIKIYTNILEKIIKYSSSIKSNIIYYL